MKRRDFITLSAGLAGISGSLLACSSPKKIRGRIIGASASVGHLLRDQQFTKPATTEQRQVVIVGGGISGLSAARYLQQAGMKDYILLDLEKQVGGNAASGANAISAYPWGAHYIPIPNNDLHEYLDFLKECNVITGISEAGLPVYNESHLCFDPQERLYINGRWQDGLVPHFGVPDKELRQIEKFLQQMDEYRHLKGADGKDVFAIPVDRSAREEPWTQLDKITMKQWMQENGFTSPCLHRYVNYCCRDDFGSPHELTSAWAGIHYFAARKGKGANAEHADVLTWPEGNGFLVRHLQQYSASQTRTQSLAVSLQATPGGVSILYLDVQQQVLRQIIAQQCILAIPQFVAARLLHDPQRSARVKDQLHYSPWMVANLTVSALQERSGAPLSWDNVLHESASLGYVEATHELLQQHIPRRNLTYYLPLTENDPATERKTAQQHTHEEWVDLIMQDLQKVHPNIREVTEEVNIMLWGHAMLQPRPGIIYGDTRHSLAASVDDKIHFAHTDLVGISIFEEAFYQGREAARKVMAYTGK